MQPLHARGAGTAHRIAAVLRIQDRNLAIGHRLAVQINVDRCARSQPRLVLARVRQRPESVHLQFEEVVVMIETARA